MKDSMFPLDLGRGILYHYITDVKQHGVYGHDGEDLVLNYLCPFLLECGYDVPRCCLLDSLDKASAKKSKSADHAYIKNYPDTPNSAEITFIKNYLDTPRSPLAYCRNSLRKHFRGRYIYTNLWKFQDAHRKLKTLFF